MPTELAFQISCVLVGIALLVSSVEYMASADLYQESNLLSWKVFGQRGTTLGVWLAPLCDGVGLMCVVGLRAIAGVALFMTLSQGWNTAAIALALLASLFLGYRSPAGGDGSDQMTIVVLSGLLIASLPINSNARMAGYWLIAAQSALSYFTAGIAKAVSPVWRDGSAPVLIFRTATYGQLRLSRFCAQYPSVSRTICWGTIVFEVGFPFALFGPLPVLAAALIAGALFHIVTAAVMGLNVFTWAFVAAYPSILVVALS
jgi:Vitamin K-dependent gamma-carboxylase